MSRRRGGQRGGSIPGLSKLRRQLVSVGPDYSTAQPEEGESKSDGAAAAGANGSSTSSAQPSAGRGAGPSSTATASRALTSTDRGRVAAAAPATVSSTSSDSSTSTRTSTPFETSRPVACVHTFAEQAITHPAGLPPSATWASSIRIQAMSIVYLIFTLFYSAEIFDWKSLGGSSRASAVSGVAHVAVFVALLGCSAAWKLAALAGMGRVARGGRWDAVKGAAYMIFVRMGVRSIMDADAGAVLSIAQAVAFVVTVLCAPLCAYAENRILHFACMLGARVHVAKSGDAKKKRGKVDGVVDGGDSGLAKVLRFLDALRESGIIIMNIQDPHTLLKNTFHQMFEDSVEVRREDKNVMH